MLQDLLMELARRATVEQAVAQATVEGDLRMLVYPLEHGLLVGLGVEGARAQSAQATRILYRRAADMARFGAWLPARLKDGSWYVLKRMPVAASGPAPLLETDLEAAAELLN